MRKIRTRKWKAREEKRMSKVKHFRNTEGQVSALSLPFRSTLSVSVCVCELCACACLCVCIASVCVRLRVYVHVCDFISLRAHTFFFFFFTCMCMSACFCMHPKASPHINMQSPCKRRAHMPLTKTCFTNNSQIMLQSVTVYSPWTLAARGAGVNILYLHLCTRER